MKTTEYIEEKINKLPKGYVFTYEYFKSEVNNREAIIKSLNRMVASGRLSKLSKGRYYKPEKTVFGELEPNQYQIVKDILEVDNKPIGYITGYGIYNELGLTTQISSVIQIGKNDTRPSTQRGKYKISFVKQKNIISKENIPLLQILDSLRYIKDIPDTTINKSCTRLIEIIKTLNSNNLNRIVKLSKKYPPATRALLGAILEYLNKEQSKDLRLSLNLITKYKLDIDSSTLPNVRKWNIL